MAQAKKNSDLRPVFIIDGVRTPFLKAAGKPGPFHAADLGFAAANNLLGKLNIEADIFDEVILGCVMPSPDEANIARIVSLRLGCGHSIPAWTVQRNCASGMQALDCAALNIAAGRSEIILAGGVEAMSHGPLLFNDKMVNWFSKLYQAKDPISKLKLLGKFRPSFLKPVIALLNGLTDPIVGLSMGQTAENLAYRFNIRREQMDRYAMQSHHRLAYALDHHHLDEIAAIYDKNGVVYHHDDGLRRDSSMEKLAKLKPVFDRKVGMITAGNSAQVTDGAAMLVLASADAVKKHQLNVLGRISDSQWSGLNPAQMGLGPAYAMSPILQRKRIKPDKIDYWEVNEAFAAQVIACIEAWKDKSFCQNELKRRSILGEIDTNKINIDGGGISMGHPVGASGARIVLHLLKTMERTNTKRGIASLCIGGGQGGAMLLERDAG